jgi:limonene-1,2-epoxide hydrolase
LFSKSAVQFTILTTVAHGSVAINNRTDRVTLPTSVWGGGGLFCAGVFCVTDGTIIEWRDYEVAPVKPVKLEPLL